MDNELYHYGVKGMKWGHRNSQPTSLQTARSNYKTAKKEYNKSFSEAYGKSYQAYSLSKKKRTANDKRWRDTANKAMNLNRAKKTYRDEKKAYKSSDVYKAKRAKAIKTGAAAAGTALAVYGTYKVSKYLKNKSAINRGNQAVNRLLQQQTALKNMARTQANKMSSADAAIERMNRAANKFR